MKLSYQLGETVYASKDSDKIDQEAFAAALEVMGKAFGIADKSVTYLLQYGWSQSLQDAYAGPRAKAIKDGESDATVEATMAAAISKRRKAIIEGEVSIGAGRDPVKTVGAQMAAEFVRSKGKVLPKDKDARASFIDKWIELNRAQVDAEIKRRKSAKGPEVSLDDLLQAE